MTKLIENLTQADVWKMSKTELKLVIEETVQRALDRFGSSRKADSYELHELHSAISEAANGLFVLGLNSAARGLLYDGPVIMNRFDESVEAHRLTVDTLRASLEALRRMPARETPVFMWHKE